ncbi:LOW QUALITY PROTEIN: hypothetical protein Cgig2_006233 [Carnegiea gigantea]|uniref:Uncharacterized protein n=1 Tax=Carnegiea gigantea TaxID=171969 RepID=A0A9Q1JSZ0_9CARY|nr:LOW QUALITY PROTEIN: hypothetical protein Cgig2_006233 [Carnegiea gigantea]
MRKLLILMEMEALVHFQGREEVDCYIDVILSDGAIPKAGVVLMRLLQVTLFKFEHILFDFCDCEVICIEVSHLHPFDQGLAFLPFVVISKFMDKEFEDFISDEDEELAVGEMCLDDSEDEDDDPDSNDDQGLAKGGHRLIHLMNSRPTPSNTTPNASASPSPTPSTTSIPNRTSSLPNLHASPYSSRRIQTLVFNSDESPQPHVDACRSISFAIQLENPPNLDSSIELSETQATQSTHATVDGSTPSTLSESSYDDGVIFTGLDPKETFIQTVKDHVPCKIVAYTNIFATLVYENKRQKIDLDSQRKVLDDVQEKLILEQAKSKKQSKKIHKYAKATQYMQAQIPSFLISPPPKPVLDSLSESEDGEEDENDDDYGGCGADE